MSVVINGAFRGQVVTGQQRYASELAARLPCRELRSSGWTQRSAVRSWAWAQSMPMRLRRDDLLLTLTSRGPVLFRRQILVVHDLFVLDHPEWYTRTYVATHAAILRAQIRSARAIVAVSEPTADRIRVAFRFGKPIHVAPNAPADVFRRVGAIDAAQVAARFGVTPGHFLLAVASADPRKNLATIIRAFQTLPEDWRREHPLVLVGGESPHVFAGARVASSGPDIRRLGYVDDTTLAALYAAAGRVLMLSLDEGFGLPAVEALAAGGRLLASDIPTMRWVCGGDALYVSPGDIPAIARALYELEVEPDTDGSAARFDWDVSADGLRRFVESVGC